MTGNIPVLEIFLFLAERELGNQSTALPVWGVERAIHNMQLPQTGEARSTLCSLGLPFCFVSILKWGRTCP